MKYLSYQLFLEEPLRIVELDASKEGEWDTLSYIPGSTIRGAVLNKLSDVMQDPIKKRMLLSDKYMFLNAYPLWNKKVFCPSVKGFYEGKIADGNLQNVLCEEKLPYRGRYHFLWKCGEKGCTGHSCGTEKYIQESGVGSASKISGVYTCGG